jgi:3-hydroxy-3-methylglutaryl CoA synthase
MTQDNHREWLQVGPSYSGLEYPVLSAVIRQFAKRGFITSHGSGKMSETYTIVVEMDADDFLSRGGHYFEEEIYRNSFTKLQLELENLEKSNPKVNFDNATKLIGAIAAGTKIYTDINNS